MTFTRTLIGFFTLLIFARMFKRQHVSQLTFFDYILGIIIGSTAASLTTDLAHSTLAHWVGLLTWIIISFLMQYISGKSKTISAYMDGKPTIVIVNGKIMEDTMEKINFQLSDLLEQLRDRGVFDIKQVQFAILERDGQLSVLKKPEYQSVTPKNLNLYTGAGGLSLTLIYDGTIIQKNLEIISKNEKWLEAELTKKGVNSIAEVFMASIDPSNRLYVDTYKDCYNDNRSK